MCGSAPRFSQSTRECGLRPENWAKPADFNATFREAKAFRTSDGIAARLDNFLGKAAWGDDVPESFLLIKLIER